MLYHLYRNFVINDKLNKYFVFGNFDSKPIEPCIFFPLSKQPLRVDKVLIINDIPVLFPMSEKNSFYRFEGNSLYFEHDLLKSAFFLLSGYQEYKSQEKDSLGRFPYDKSIQSHLKIIEKPIVNYYFEIIVAAIQEFCRRNEIEFARKKLFDKYGFFLTHDVDKIDQYNFSDSIFKVKQILKLAPTKVSYGRMLNANIHYLLNYINIFNKKNRFWNFAQLNQIEQEIGIKSAWYFLENDSPSDSYYGFSEKRIGELIQYLEANGHEVGIHGTIRSAVHSCAMHDALSKLNALTSHGVVGGRQHRLMFSMPQTHLIHEKLSLKYDSSLGFAAHEGFRNSYCLPFKLYDFEAERIIDVWEFPLLVMDGTLFSYRQLTNEQALVQIKKILSEVRKFHGLFTLLWHNSFFDDRLYPEISSFYESALRTIVEDKPDIVLGRDLINIL